MRHESYRVFGHGRHPSDNRTYDVYAADPCNDFPAWAVGQCTTRRDLEGLRLAVAAEIARVDAEDAAESARIEQEERDEADAASELPTAAEPFRGARGVPPADAEELDGIMGGRRRG